ncbi:MAG: metallophosphoesterase [Acidimicrobiia bacterium]
MTLIAAVGDIHVGRDSVGQVAPGLAHVGERADVLLLAGDLTRCGDPEEAELAVGELRDVQVPVVAVLGNHDHHDDRPGEVTAVLEAGGIRVLQGAHVTIDIGGTVLGIAGVKGFGSGFAGAGATAFGEPAMKAFVREAQLEAAALHDALAAVAGEADRTVALLHYSPVPDTLRGERPEIYPFLGSHLLAEAVDTVGADLVIHGHAHAGSERGVTPGGVRVRNVAQPVIQRAYRLFDLRTPVHERLHVAAEA